MNRYFLELYQFQQNFIGIRFQLTKLVESQCKTDRGGEKDRDRVLKRQIEREKERDRQRQRKREKKGQTQQICEYFVQYSTQHLSYTTGTSGYFFKYQISYISHSRLAPLTAWLSSPSDTRMSHAHTLCHQSLVGLEYCPLVLVPAVL